MNGTVLAKDVGKTNINAQYSGEVAHCPVTVTSNSTNTKFRVLDMTIANSTYQLEFLANGSPVPFNTLTVHQTVQGIVSLDLSNGTVTPIKDGDDLITVIYNGKKYGHHVKVSGKSVMALSLEADEEPVPKRTRTRKKKIEE